MADEPQLLFERAMTHAAAGREAGNFDDAEAQYRRALALQPDNPKALQHFGAMLAQLTRYDEAEAHLRRALPLAPKEQATRLSLSGVLRAQGQYAEGWALYDARFDLAEAKAPRPDLPFPQWRSWDVTNRKILVMPEQGLGDQIMMARFLPSLVAQGADVTLMTPPALLQLFTDSFPSVTVKDSTPPFPISPPDFWLPTTDLPGLLQVTPETLPIAPYLTTTADWPALLPELNIGLATKGRPEFWQDQRRSLDPATAESLRSQLPGNVVSLHPEDSGARDFAETAALMSRLDLVVSVDTSVAHLAGALGKPCFTLIPGFGTDWRWGQDRDVALWYPTMRLYRSRTDGDWRDAIARLMDGVTAFVARL